MPDDEGVVVRAPDGMLARRNGGRHNDVRPAAVRLGFWDGIWLEGQ